ncbi:hypothetical protein J4G33_01335 [Actinotalea sp. BY-33]|uniref:Uncharacterized protein n=1 Tax=Actinotalea soli TaxID=2819234 RepID=A0A939RS82_9CELL|nr:hypothetical protein [Actinotalea soli]MBO1750442.1 hypothetical protein [Actinotalea soli]
MNDALVVLVVLAALALSALGGWPLTAAVLRVAARSHDARHETTRGAVDPEVRPDAEPDLTGEGVHAPAGPALEPDLAAAAEPDPARAPGPGADPTSSSSLRGGTWIGVLERLAVTACLVAGYPAGIAFVIAVKGLGRYPEIRQHPETSERFVIGTLASMLWAVAVGAVARLLVSG